jgi:cytochrome P450
VTGNAASPFPAYPMPRSCPFDPPPELSRIQRCAPITRVRLWDGSKPWLITRCGDARQALADPSSSANPELPGYPHVSAGGAAQQRLVKTLLDLDDPEHAAQRRLLIPEFTFRKCQALRPTIQQIVDGLLDDLLAGPKPGDLVTRLALPLSSSVVCRLLGVPYADHGFFQRASNVVISSHASPEQSITAAEELLGYLGGLVTAKSLAPADDLLSRLAVGQFSKGLMSREQIASMTFVLLVAGHETTANMIALGTALLLDKPALLDELRASDDLDLVAAAVEEILRYLSIVQSGRRRVATADMDVGGQLIRRGEGMIVATDIANRDASVFADPGTLDFSRDAHQHLAFGHGVHQCLGQTLARVELQVTYRSLFRRVPTLALAVPLSELAFRHDAVVYGVERLPVAW